MTVTARDIYRTRMTDQFWGLGETTPNRTSIKAGDRIVFYIANPERVFAGTATTSSPSFELSDDESQRYSHGTDFYFADYGVKLTDIVIWDSAKFVPDMVHDLSFVENKKYWGSYFQGGVRGISESDYMRITSAASLPHSEPADILESDNVADEQQFALEAHLEEFIHANWSKLDWGRSLRLYQTPDSDGRQFPAGMWSIDFLAVDNETDELVVIELKRGRSSDAAVGQTLRYIGWVREQIAKPDQGVVGIIVCQTIDDALRYAVANSANVNVMTYRVDFVLEGAGL